MTIELNQLGQKRYKYKSANVNFSWNEQRGDTAEETTIKITWKFLTSGDKVEEHSYTRTVAQIDAFYIPLLRIVLGIDSISTALLYVNDTYAKGIYLRMIENGTDFLTFSGIKVNEDGTRKLDV